MLPAARVGTMSLGIEEMCNSYTERGFYVPTPLICFLLSRDLFFCFLSSRRTVAHYIPFRAIRAGKQLSDSKGASAAISTGSLVVDYIYVAVCLL